MLLQVPGWVEGGRVPPAAQHTCYVLLDVGVASREAFFCAFPLFPTPLRVEPKRIVGLTEAGGFWDSPNCDGLAIQWPEAQDLTPLGSAN